MDDASREIHRSRWRRERERLGLIDICQQGFANGGLGQYVSNLTVRVVILGADPDYELIDFDSEFWSWWKTDRKTPFGTSPEDWGRVIPTTSAAVRYRTLLDKSWNWDSYVAVCRHGGLEVGLGHDGAAPVAEKKLIFRLICNVGRLWSALDRYGEIVQRFKIKGPRECSVALVGMADGVLGNFATGWLQYPDPEANRHSCPEPNLLRHWELDEWPTQDALRDIAFSAGSWIENSWGMQLRRFIARSGPFEGQFDASHYR
jgi:hypothetical protein